LVGADEPLFRPGWHPPEPFHALFVGKLIPLHGLETILAAAALLPDVAFRVVGDGQLAGLLEGRPPNVEHVPWLPYEDLPEAYRAAGCGLGISGRAKRRPA
jgi:glycosyltransferase involved in cell wall biosynthesis